MQFPLISSRDLFRITALALALAAGGRLIGQATTLTLLSRDGRRSLPLTLVNNQDFVALDDLAKTFQLSVREEAGAITVTYKNRTIVLTPEQGLASISGRLLSLPARPVRTGGRWLVPVEFISRALAPVYDVRLDLRRASRLLVIGDVRVPRVTVRHDPLGPAARLTIDATPGVASTVTQDGNRLLVRFEADALDLAPPVIQSQGIVQGVRAVDGVTLAVDLGERFAAFRASTDKLDDTVRVLIEFTAKATDTTGTPAPPITPVERPAFGRRATPIGTIAIDAGHGGEDTGAKGARGTLEKDLTLAVARKMKSAIETRLGIRVILTRDEDRHIALDERPAVANNNKADLFVSLHANASVRPSVQGAAVYVAAFSEAERARSRQTPAARMPVFGGGARDIDLVPWELAQLGYLDRSAEAARIIGDQFRQRVALADTQVGEASFRVLESANMPAVLIEMGYLSNAAQEAQLASNEFQGALTTAVIDAVVKFRDYLGGNGGER